MIFLLFLKTMNCYHCSSFNLLETTENLTCLDCSRVQNYSLVESNDFSIPKVDYDFDLAEFFERSYFTKKEKDLIQHRLNRLRNCKSLFSKNDKIISLLYITNCEGGYFLSPQTFSKQIGCMIKTSKLTKCVNYCVNVLKIKNIDIHVNWCNLLNPYCEKFKFFKQNSITLMTEYCLKIRKISNLSVYTIACLAFLCVYIRNTKCIFKQILNQIASFSKITPTTIRKNYLLYCNFDNKE